MIFVVDTNIVTSASDCSEADEAIKCRDLLECIFLNNSHKIGISTELKNEYEKHWSSYSRKWYTSMMRHARVERHNEILNRELRDIIRRFLSQIFQREHIPDIWTNVEKDIHLLELAIVCDKIIISNENYTRDRLKRLSRKSHKDLNNLKLIFWLRPSECQCETFNLIQWIRETDCVDKIPKSHLLLSSH